MAPKTTIYHGNNVNLVESLPKFHCVVTSPPYKSEQGFDIDQLVRLHIKIGEKLEPGGRVFINFGQLSEDYSRPYQLQQALANATESGLIPSQTFIWAKSIVIDNAQRGHFKSITSPRILNYCWEYVFSFYKPLPDGKEPPFDRLSVGVPYADKSNLTRGTRGKNGDVHCAGDIWFIPYETKGKTKKKKHEYEFPLALVERCIKLAGLAPGSTVLDPFGGSGSVSVSANKLGFDAILLERDRAHVNGCVERGAILIDPLEKVWESLPKDLSSDVDGYLYSDEVFRDKTLESVSTDTSDRSDQQ